jgi:TatD DNase family protein
MLIDSHSHLYAEEFKDDLPQVIQRAKEAGITHIFMPNEDSTTIKPLLKTCKKYEGYCFPMIGLHPTSVDESYKRELIKIGDALKSEKSFVAIGEVGLDMHWDKTYLKEQLAVFEQQVCWALESDLPIIIHCRDAFDEMMDVLDHYSGTPLRGIFHSYTGNPFEAVKMLNMPGFLLGINGIVTYRRSVLPDVLGNISIDRIVLETDSPYLTPEPFRGKRNESSYLVYTLKKVADLYDMKPAAVAKKTAENTLKLFGMLS